MTTIQDMAQQHHLGRIADALARAARPCLQGEITRLNEGEQHLIGATRLGGTPDLPPDFVWPRWRDTPLSFLLQVNLADIAAFAVARTLPAGGFLWFFYDPEQRTWGFDPEDRGSWHVEYRAVSPAALVRQSPPVDAALLSLEDGSSDGSRRFVQQSTFLSCSMSFAEAQSLPDVDEASITLLGLSDTERKDYLDVQFVSYPSVQLLGYPLPIQGAGMAVECQLASHGIYCGHGYPAIPEHEAEAAQWRLLLQLQSNDAGMEWGDGGTLYFWMHECDLHARNFANVWMILQCS